MTFCSTLKRHLAVKMHFVALFNQDQSIFLSDAFKCLQLIRRQYSPLFFQKVLYRGKNVFTDRGESVHVVRVPGMYQDEPRDPG